MKDFLTPLVIGLGICGMILILICGIVSLISYGITFTAEHTVKIDKSVGEIHIRKATGSNNHEMDNGYYASMYPDEKSFYNVWGLTEEDSLDNLNAAIKSQLIIWN